MLPSTPDLKDHPDRWQPVVERIARTAGLHVTGFTPYAAGGALVAAVSEDAVVKLVQPGYADEVEAELRALGWLEGADLPVPIPELLATGEEDGWTWLILSRLPGVSLDTVWDGLTPTERHRLASRIGALMGSVAAVQLPRPEQHAATWSAFLEAQRDGVVARHARLGMPDWFLAGLEDAVAHGLDALDPSARPIVLTGEYTPFNLHVERTPSGLELCGMLDFGDAFAGHPAYDLLGPSVFLFPGDAAGQQALFGARGWTGPTPSRQALHALHLLHRFSDLRGQIALPGWEQRVSSHAQLRDLVWPGFPDEG